MTFRIDAQLPPILAKFIAETFGVQATALRELGLRDAPDRLIFDKARESGATLITKNTDFVGLNQRLGPPPRIVWVSCGNSSNAHVQALFEATFGDALKLLEQGAAIVEIGDAAAQP